MRRHRTTARGGLSLILALGLTAGVAAASTGTQPGDGGPGPATKPKPKPKPAPHTTGPPARVSAERIIFPVVGKVQYTNDFGAPRSQGSHQGNDLMAPRKALAVAAEAGKVKFWTHSGSAGCMLYLYGKSGTTYLYIHLNNDLTNGNDNRGRCAAGTSYAPGLKDGQKVQAGQLVGFVGDSGDANGVAPHLHFELHPGDGAAVSPFTSLNRAYRLLFAAPRKGQTALWLKGSVLAHLAEAFKVQVSSLGVRTTGLKLNGISRAVSLGVSPSTVIETLAGSLGGEKRATVWTEIAPVTLDAQLGKPGALTAERVLLSR